MQDAMAQMRDVISKQLAQNKLLREQRAALLLKSIEVNPPDEELPKLSAMRGLWRGATDGLGAVEFLDKHRE